MMARRSLPREERPIVLEVEELHKVYPITKGAIVRRKVGEQRAVDGSRSTSVKANASPWWGNPAAGRRPP